jgi:hypothetical protein
MKDVYYSINDRDKLPQGSKVEKMELIYTLDETESIHKKYNTIVRTSVDGEEETLEDLLNRFNNTWTDDYVDWFDFIGYFTRRGRLRDNEGFHIKKHDKQSEQDLADLISKISEEDPSIKAHKLKNTLTREVIYKKITNV